MKLMFLIADVIEFIIVLLVYKKSEILTKIYAVIPFINFLHRILRVYNVFRPFQKHCSRNLIIAYQKKV